MTVMKRLENAMVVPVVVLERTEDALPTATALLAGGVDAMEITFRTPSAPEAIHQVSECCPEMLVGAGTIINVEQAKLAVEMGAQFIVSPGFSCDVVSWCVEHQVAVIPGCVTPTEIMAAMAQGLTLVKFFPASVYGGLQAMINLSAPFPGLKFLPTGGVDGGNIKDYLTASFVHAVGGSWICPKELIRAGDWAEITRLCQAARARGKGG